MDSRRKFKADISNKIVQKRFAKKPSMAKQADATTSVESKPSNKTVTSIPADMLPKLKTPLRAEKEHSNSELWAKPDKGPALSREEVLKVEKASIKEKLVYQRDWSRAARSLSTAMDQPKKSSYISDPFDDDEDDNRGNRRHRPDQNCIERKNLSKEFLQSFFETAKSVSKKRKLSITKGCGVRKIPKLASGIEPGADELIL